MIIRIFTIFIKILPAEVYFFNSSLIFCKFWDTKLYIRPQVGLRERTVIFTLLLIPPKADAELHCARGKFRNITYYGQSVCCVWPPPVLCSLGHAPHSHAARVIIIKQYLLNSPMHGALGCVSK